MRHALSHCAQIVVVEKGRGYLLALGAQRIRSQAGPRLGLAGANSADTR